MTRVSRGLVSVFAVLLLSNSARVWDGAAFNLAASRAARTILAVAPPEVDAGQFSGDWVEGLRPLLPDVRFTSAGAISLRALVAYLAMPPSAAAQEIRQLIGTAGEVRPIVRLWLGSAYATQGTYEEAISLWSQVGAGWRLKVLGETLAAHGRWDLAAEAYTACLRTLRDDAAPYLGLGRALEELGRENDALVVYERAVARIPRNYGAYVAIGDIYRGWRMFDDAQAWYERGVGETGEREWTYIASARAYEMEGALDLALGRLEWVVEHHQSNCQGWARLGLVLLKLGLNERATEALEEGNTLCPGVHWLEEALEGAREVSGGN